MVKFITIMVKCFIICHAIQLALGISVRNPLTVALFFFCLFLDKNCQIEVQRNIRFIITAVSVLASIAVLVMVSGRVTDAFDSKLFKAVAVAILFFGFVSFAELLIKAGYCLLTGQEFRFDIQLFPKIRWNSRIMLSRMAVLLSAACICFICWLPYFLYEFPGIMTADSLVQYEQVIGVREWSNHHPLIHTLCIAFFYKIGLFLTGDINKAVSVYTLAQMIFMALCCGRSVLETAIISGGKSRADRAVSDKEERIQIGIVPLAALAFFALVPFNAVFAVTIWKDVPFAGIMMLLICCLLDIIRNNKENYTMFIVLSVLFCLFRSNAWYAFILSIPFLIFAFREKIKNIITAVVVVLLVVIVIKGPMMDVAGVEQPDFVESLSLPLQQVARVLVDDRDVSWGDLRLIDAVIDRTYIHELYAADFADNMKELVRAGHPEMIENNKGRYFGLWLRLMMKYPGEYLAAWYDLEGGYIYPDFQYDVGNIDGIMGNDHGLVSTPLIGGKVVIKTKEILIKLGTFLPLYGMFWCIGAYTWFMVLALALTLKNREYWKYLPLAVMPLMIIATLCIAAPLVDFRYGYGIVMTMPIFAALCVNMEGERNV